MKSGGLIGPLIAIVLLVSVLPVGQGGIFVDGVISTDNPSGLTVDRSDNTNNVLSWSAPSTSDGRTLVGYWLYRSPGTAVWDPVYSVWIPAGTTSFRDTWGTFSQTYVYFVESVFQDAATTTNGAVSAPVVAGPGYPGCFSLQWNVGNLPDIHILRKYDNCFPV